MWLPGPHPYVMVPMDMVSTEQVPYVLLINSQGIWNVLLTVNPILSSLKYLEVLVSLLTRLVRNLSYVSDKWQLMAHIWDSYEELMTITRIVQDFDWQTVEMLKK